MCLYCRETKKKNTFTTGCPSVRPDIVRLHEKCDEHKCATVEFAKLKKAHEEKAKLEEDVAWLESQSQEAVTALIKRLKLVYYILSHDRPLSDFTDLLKMQEPANTKLGGSRNSHSSAIHFSSLRRGCH